MLWWFSTGKHVTYALVVRKGQNPAKFDRCLREVEAKGGDVNAYAVCTAAGTSVGDIQVQRGLWWNVLDERLYWDRDGKSLSKPGMAEERLSWHRWLGLWLNQAWDARCRCGVHSHAAGIETARNAWTRGGKERDTATPRGGHDGGDRTPVHDHPQYEARRADDPVFENCQRFWLDVEGPSKRGSILKGSQVDMCVCGVL